MPDEHSEVVAASTLPASKDAEAEAAAAASSANEDDGPSSAGSESAHEATADQGQGQHQEGDDEKSHPSASSLKPATATAADGGSAGGPATSVPASEAGTTAAASTTESSSSSSAAAETSTGPSPPAAAAVSAHPLSAGAPEENVPIPVSGPYRHNRKRIPAHKLPKGILKPAPTPAPRFSFRRDVLSYMGDSLNSPINLSLNSIGNALSAATGGGGGGGGGGAGLSSPDAQAQQGHPVQPAHPPHAGDSSARQVEGSTSHAPVQAAPAQHPPAAKSGAFWRRLGGAVTAVAAQVPVPQAAQRTINQLAERGHHQHGGHGPAAQSHHPSSSSASGSGHGSNDASSALSPTNASTSSLSLDSVKSVRFTMSSLTVVYPISAPIPPGAEASTRKRIHREYRAKDQERLGRGGWTVEELTRLYDECCRTREEPGIDQLRRILMASTAPPKVIDLKDVQLTKGAVDVLSDLLSVEFGLKKLVLENCGLDDESLKPLVHSLLVSATLPTISLANNKRIRNKGWRLISLLVRKSPALRYLDISDNLIDKKIAENLVDAISNAGVAASLPPSTSRQADPPAGDSATSESPEGTEGEQTDAEECDLPPPKNAPLLSRSASARSNASEKSSALSSLRLESCSLKNPTLEALATGVRQSEIKHISLRRNKINNLGAVALAVMIRDYELPSSSGPSQPAGGDAHQGAEGAGLFSPRLDEHRPGSPSLHQPGFSFNHAHKAGTPLPPPPTHPALNNRTHLSSSTSSGNSVTARLEAAASQRSSLPALPAAGSPPRATSSLPSSLLSHAAASTSSTRDDSEDADHEAAFGPERNRGRVILPEREAVRHAEMKARLKKQIDALPRVGSLLTLDVRSNEIKGGVTYIAQVLKRNRTLKVLNLSDNKIDSQGLMNIAEALKYNSTLETLDLSNNPCCGGTLEGVMTLRTAFAFNTSLMRIFLNNTDFSTAASISLAEFLPEVHSLIHLDLTDNPDIEIAGIMALAASVKLNRTLRCLDLSIPPNDAEYARLSQDILQSCIRNTELAQEQSALKGIKGPIAQPIYKSEIARELRELEEHSKQRRQDIDAVLDSIPEGAGKSNALRTSVRVAKECVELLEEIVLPDEERRKRSEAIQGAEIAKLVLDQATAAESQLSEAMRPLRAGSDEREAVGALANTLSVLLLKAGRLYGSPSVPVSSVSCSPARQSSLTALSTTNLSEGTFLSPVSTPSKSPASPVAQIPSPSFSITDSDDSDTDTLDSRADGRTPPTSPHRLQRFGEQQTTARRSRPISLELPGSGDASSSAAAAMQSSPRSPVESHSRVMVLEEGEVFRKGTSMVAGSKTLLDVLDDESEDGQELEQKILDTEVERTSRRASVGSLEETSETKDPGPV